jgi:hypothetical protein
VTFVSDQDVTCVFIESAHGGVAHGGGGTTTAVMSARRIAAHRRGRCTPLADAGSIRMTHEPIGPDTESHLRTFTANTEAATASPS